mmetsp:Transcript_19696/g.14435  ORF Transcript_19696/g.14435 Transcript_19696/m.14435 type:complete len:218 (-) Transcript_19696:1788-2441(-)
MSMSVSFHSSLCLSMHFFLMSVSFDMHFSASSLLGNSFFNMNRVVNCNFFLNDFMDVIFMSSHSSSGGLDNHFLGGMGSLCMYDCFFGLVCNFGLNHLLLHNFLGVGMNVSLSSCSLFHMDLMHFALSIHMHLMNVSFLLDCCFLDYCLAQSFWNKMIFWFSINLWLGLCYLSFSLWYQLVFRLGINLWLCLCYLSFSFWYPLIFWLGINFWLNLSF